MSMSIQKLSQKDFSVICRICMKQAKLNSIFKYTTMNRLGIDTQDLYFKLKQCSNIEIGVGDELPSNICDECVKLLDVAYDFKILCEESHQKLKKILTNNTKSDCSKQNIERGRLLKMKNNPPRKKVIVLKVRGKGKILSKCGNLLGSPQVLAVNAVLIRNKKTNADKIIPVVQIHPKENKTGSKCIVNKAIKNEIIHKKESYENIQGCYLKSDEENISFSDIKHEPNYSDDNVFNTNETYKYTVFNKTLAKEVNNHSFKNETFNENVESFSKNNYICQICERKFSSKLFFDKHVSKHGNKFKNNEDSRFSKICYTKSDKGFPCSKCGKKMMSHKDYNSHMKIHRVLVKKTEKLELRIKCPNCIKIFRTRHDLKKHEMIHNSTQEFMCEICGKAFLTPYRLKAHKRYHFTHYECDHCSYSTNDKNSLRIHLHMHSGNKQYFCEICGTGTITKSNLNAHIRRHNKIKNHKCDNCDKCFTEKRTLEDHIWSTHLGQRRNTCMFCDKTYTRRNGLRHHIQKCHPETLKKN